MNAGPVAAVRLEQLKKPEKWQIRAELKPALCNKS